MKISVVIPMYNAEKTIIRTLNSATQQTVVPDEILIINDGSTDASAQIATHYINKNSCFNIRLIHKENGGASAARNMGIKNAAGTWIAFLDADDVWEKNKLERQLQCIKKDPSIDLIGSGRNQETVSRFFFKKFGKLTKISSRLLLYKNFFSTPTVLLKKEVVNKVGFFDEAQKYAEEGDYWIRVCKNGNCYYLNESLTRTDEKPYYGHSGLSSNLKEMEKGELKNIKTGKRLKIVNSTEYHFLRIYSLLKYFRRVLIVKLRSLC